MPISLYASLLSPSKRNLLNFPPFTRLGPLQTRRVPPRWRAGRLQEREGDEEAKVGSLFGLMIQFLNHSLVTRQIIVTICSKSYNLFLKINLTKEWISQGSFLRSLTLLHFILFNKLRTAHAAIFNEIETSPPFHRLSQEWTSLKESY